MASALPAPSKSRFGFRRLFARFRNDERGNMGVVFGLTVTPTLFMAAAAIDYSAAGDLQTNLRRATDGTALKLCQMPSTSTTAQLKAAAEQSMKGLMGTKAYKIDDLTLHANPRKVSIATSARYSTAIMKAMGASFTELPVGAQAQCANPQQTLEIALVLDNTGSMASSSNGSSKMDALKTAATNFVKFVYATPKLAQAKISIVPFAAGVAVSPQAFRNAPWLDGGGKASSHWSFVGDVTSANATSAYGWKNRLDVFGSLKSVRSEWDWTGCLESLPYPYNVRDGAPSSSNPDSYFVPMLAPDESGDGGQIYHKDPSNNTITSINSYLDDSTSSPTCAATDDETTRIGRACKYTSVKGAKTSNGSVATGPNYSCTTRPLTRLTNDSALVQREIAAMQPNGNTNTHEGFIWGWRTLSPASVFADGAAYNKPYNNKIIVLMTDGMNTWPSNPYSALKSYYSAYGYFNNPDGSKPNGKLPPANANPSSDGQARAAMDALTLEACKNAAASNIQIYTIGFSVASDPIDKQGINMLAKCAGSSERAFVANDAKGLTAAFQSIADNVGQLRLTN